MQVPTAKPPPPIVPPNVSVFELDDDDDDDDDGREFLSGFKLMTVVVSVCLVMFLSLLDSSIVATAVSKVLSTPSSRLTDSL